MQTIIIGRNYEEMFNAAFRIAEHLSRNSGDSTYCVFENYRAPYADDLCDDMRAIEDKGTGYIFCYDPYDLGSARFAGDEGLNNEQALGFNYDGATWFKNLRENSISADAKWEDCTEALRQLYHKNYSILEYRQNPRDSEADDEVAVKVEKELRKLFPALAELTPIVTPVVDPQNQFGGSVDIYGMTLRVALGSPEPIHIICRLFFRADGTGDTRPMYKAEAEDLNQMIMNANLNDVDQRRDEASGLRDNALRALEKFINEEREGQFRFKDCIFFTQRTGKKSIIERTEDGQTRYVTEDEQRLRELRKSNAHNNSDIECGSVEVLSISHIKWDSAMYDISYEGFNKKTFRLMLGLNDSISLQCLNCGDRELLIDNNRIKVFNGNAVEREVVVNVCKPGLGLSEKDLEAVIERSRFAAHLGGIAVGNESSCKLKEIMQSYPNMANARCNIKVRCKSQIEERQFGDKTEEVCTNCPYAEILYTDPNTGKRHATYGMHYFVDDHAFMDEQEVSHNECRICHRAIDAEKNYCDTCAQARAISMSEAKDAAASKRFKRYCGALPMGTRVASLGKRRACFEDDSFLIFVIGKHIYALNKLDIATNGYIPAPRKAQ